MPGFTPPDGTTVLAPSSAVPGWTAEYAVPLGGPVESQVGAGSTFYFTLPSAS